MLVNTLTHFNKLNLIVKCYPIIQPQHRANNWFTGGKVCGFFYGFIKLGYFIVSNSKY